MLRDRITTEAKRYLVYTTTSVGEIGYSLGLKDAAYAAISAGFVYVAFVIDTYACRIAG